MTEPTVHPDDLVEHLATTTPLSLGRAQQLHDAYPVLLPKLVASGCPWYLLDAAAQACLESPSAAVLLEIAHP